LRGSQSLFRRCGVYFLFPFPSRTLIPRSSTVSLVTIPPELPRLTGVTLNNCYLGVFMRTEKNCFYGIRLGRVWSL
jgi:hypothetical protein